MSLALAAALCAGPDVIASRAGMVYELSGEIFRDDLPFELLPGRFPILEPGEVLRVEAGEATLLLNPGTYLDVHERSRVWMTKNHLEDTRVRLAAGSFHIRRFKTMGHNRITVLLRDAQIMMGGKVEIFFDAEAGNILVVKGKAAVVMEGKTVILGKGRSMNIPGEVEHAGGAAERRSRRGL